MNSLADSDIKDGLTVEQYLANFKKDIDELFNKKIDNYVVDGDVYTRFEEIHEYCLLDQYLEMSHEEKFNTLRGFEYDDDKVGDKFEALARKEENLKAEEKNVPDGFSDWDKFEDQYSAIKDEQFLIVTELEEAELARIRGCLEEESANFDMALNAAKNRGKAMYRELKDAVVGMVKRVERAGLNINSIEVSGGFGEPVDADGERMSQYFGDDVNNWVDLEEQLNWVKKATRCSMPSIYVGVDNDNDDWFSLRVADHEQVSGGGWIQSNAVSEGGYRAGESDFSVVVNEYEGYDESVLDVWLKDVGYEVKKTGIDQGR